MTQDTLQQRVADYLEKALALMNADGKHWFQGDFRSGEPEADGRYAFCSIGALREVIVGSCFSYTDSSPIYNAAEVALARAVAPDSKATILSEADPPGDGVRAGSVIVTWNDDPDTTWEDVVECFTKAKESVLS